MALVNRRDVFIEWGDCDPAGIVYYPRYFVMFDNATVALFAAAVKSHLGNGGAAIIATHIDLGFDTDTLDITAFKPTRAKSKAFDEAFL